MKTKFLTILLAILIFGLQNIAAQTETQIAKIRAEVAVINKNVAKYKKTTKNVDGISLEGTEAKFYSLGANLKKTTAKIYGESFNATAEIYYKDNTPIFIYEKLNKYDKPIGDGNTYPKVVSVEQKRIYYVDGQIIKILVGKKEIKSTDEKFEELKKEFLDFSNTLLEAFKN